MTPDEAIEIVARHHISSTIRAAMDTDYRGWDNYPEIGERDWRRISDLAEKLTPPEPSRDMYEQAYELLADRTDDGPEGIEWQDAAAGLEG